LIMVVNDGAVVDGDEITFIIARQLYQRGLMRGAVVGTHMSNLGFERAVQTLGLEFKRVNVGDRYILEMLQANDWVLGGETSGHIICLDLTSTGDGIISALQVLEAVVRSQNTLSVLKSGMSKFPQRLINVRLSERQDVTSIAEIREAVSAAERRLGTTGRVLLRPSGTEPLIRVMVEGQDSDLVDELAESLAATVQAAVNPNCTASAGQAA
jgi:phosphoglucosamine mutase